MLPFDCQMSRFGKEKCPSGYWRVRIPFNSTVVASNWGASWLVSTFWFATARLSISAESNVEVR